MTVQWGNIWMSVFVIWVCLFYPMLEQTLVAFMWLQWGLSRCCYTCGRYWGLPGSPGIELETELDSHSGKCEHLAKIYGSLLIIVELGVHKCFVEFSSNRVTEFPVNHKENGISKLRSQITDTDCRWHLVITFSDKNLLHRLQGDKILCCVWEWKNSDFFFLD